MKRLSLFVFFQLFFTILWAQNCDSYPVATKSVDWVELTQQYRQIIERQMQDNDTILPSNFMEIARCFVQNVEKARGFKSFSISKDMIKERPDLVFLILDSRSLENENKKQSWFNLFPIMNDDQKVKLYDILSKEYLKIHEVNRRYETRKAEIAQKYEHEVIGYNKCDTIFKLLGAVKQYSSNGITIGTFMDEWHINPQGLAVGLNTGKTIHLDSIDIFSGDNMERWKEDDYSKDIGTIMNYEKFIYSYLMNVKNHQTSFPNNDLMKKTLFSLWKKLMEDYYQKTDKFVEFKQLVDFPMEDYFGNDKKKDICANRYKYIMLSKLREYDYDSAAVWLSRYIQNRHFLESPTSFLFYLYVSVLGNNNATNSNNYADAEQAFVNWYKTATMDDLLNKIPTSYIGTEFLMADYYLLYGRNDELKNIVNDLLIAFKNKLELGNLKFDYDDPDWYEFLNNTYFSDMFETNYTRDDLQNQLVQKGFNNVEHMVEYETYYCLYKMKNARFENMNSQELQNIQDVLYDVERKCANPSCNTYFYCEKDISKDLQIRLQRILASRNLSAAIHISPKIQFVANVPKDTKYSKQMIQFIAGNGTGDIKYLDVFVSSKSRNEVRQKIRDFITSEEPTAWSYSQDVDLEEGENTIIIRCADVDGFETVDTLKITYSPDNYMNRRDYAILFAVDDYTKVDRFNNLEKPIHDAERFAELLVEYGFDTLIVRNPTRSDIFKTIRFYQSKTYGDYDQLLIFYAGHGYIDDFGGGYMIPKDGNIDQIDDKLVDYSSFATQINNIPCKHILIVCDACHSGSFLAQQTRGVNPDVKLQNEIMKHKSRLFIGSCTAKDETPDNSQLMGKIFELFENQSRDIPIDFYNLVGLATTTEGQEKSFGSFLSHENNGDFFFNRR